MNFRRDLMIRSDLPVPLSSHLKEELLQRTPQQYLKDQRSILKWLQSSRENFRKYFERFYENHEKVDEWLATEERLQDYRFETLLVHSLEEHQAKMNFKSKATTLLRSQAQPTSNGCEPFQKRAGLAGFFASNFESSLPRQSTILKELKYVSSYDFYRETFHACEGKKYISYDYEKHMKARSEQSPQFQSPNRLKHFSEKIHNANIGTSFSADEWNTTEPSTSHEKIRKLLVSRTLSSRLLGNGNRQSLEEGPRRVVLVNHSGKPIYFDLR